VINSPSGTASILIEMETSVPAGRSERSVTAGRVPWAMVGLALLVLLTTTVLMVAGGSEVGATWDERIHALMTQTYFLTGWYASPDWLVNGDLDPFTGKWPYFVYAPVASLIAHAAAVLTGNESWNGFSDSAAAHAARHLGTAAIAAAGVLGVVGITRTITRSWRWAVVSAAVLASTPMWIGHGMFNVKDLPVGTGYTLATLGLVLVVRRDYARRTGLRVLAWASLTVGVILAVGTRPASGLPIALTAIVMSGVGLVLLVRSRRRPRLKGWGLWPRAIDPVGGLVLAYVVLTAIYPNGFINPWRLVKETLLISGRFPVYDLQLTNGVWLSQPPPWTYLPTWFGAQLPLLVIIGCAVFAVWWLVLVVRLARRGRGGGRGLERVLLPVPVIAQALLFALLAIAVQSTIYNGVRQFLFVLPAVAVLATLGIRALVARLGSHRVVGALVWVGVAVGLVVPTIDQIRLFPYGYVYFNEIASLKPIDGNWATDYWRASGRELVRIIPPGTTSCVLVDERRPLTPCDGDATLKPFWAERGLDARPGELGSDEYWLVRENGGAVEPPPGCVLHDEITRPLRGQQITIAQVLRCEVPR
jgi:hypothetical protein